MSGVVRTGDLFGMGGVVTAPAAASVTVNGRPIALQGAAYTPHLGCSPKSPQHCTGVIFDQSAGVTVEGSIPLTKSAIGVCGHSPSTSSDDVFIVGGGFGLLGSALSFGLGQLDFGASDLGGLASGYAEVASSVTDSLNVVSSTVSEATGGGALGQIAGGAAKSFVTSVGTGVVRNAASVAAGGRSQSLTSVLESSAIGSISGAVTNVVSGAVNSAIKKTTDNVRQAARS